RPHDLAPREVEVLELVPPQAGREALATAFSEIDSGICAENCDPLDLDFHGSVARPAAQHDLVRPHEAFAEAHGVAYEAQDELRGGRVVEVGGCADLLQAAVVEDRNPVGDL